MLVKRNLSSRFKRCSTCSICSTCSTLSTCSIWTAGCRLILCKFGHSWKKLKQAHRHSFVPSPCGMIRDDSKYGYDSYGQNFFLKFYHWFQKMVLISFKGPYKIGIFPKFKRCGSKIEPATPFWSLKFKRAWQA